MFEHLFAPIKIRDMELKNRIILPAMGTRMAAENGAVTDKLIAYHAARAKGGCALNIVEVAAVHTPSAPAHFVSISEDYLIEGHKKLTDAIHENGGKAGIQLWQGSIAACMDPKAQMLVVSDMNFGAYMIKAITKEQIQEVIACYGKAAARAVEAGYDCLEFHLAHNYLPHSFLSAGFNHREDEYGGSFENRCRFPLEVIDEIRKNMPEGMPLFIRIDAQDDMLENGLTIEDVIRFCKIAKEHGVDVKGKKMVVLGAGGAATALTVQCALDGAASIAIFNPNDPFLERAKGTAEKLAKEVPDCKVNVYCLDDQDKLREEIANADILANGTLAGMKPHDDLSLVDKSMFHPNLVVADCVYNPEETKMVKEAKEAGFENLKGHRTVGGMRASIYNAMPKAGVEKLVEFMKKFEEENA